MIHDNRSMAGMSRSRIFVRGIGLISQEWDLPKTQQDIGSAVSGEQPVAGPAPLSEMPPPGTIIRTTAPWHFDICLRAGGLCLIAISLTGIFLLVRMVRTPVVHPATLSEMLLAAVGVLAMSLGSVLLLQGARLLDRVVTAKPRMSEL